jgi:hypothetical protein
MERADYIIRFYFLKLSGRAREMVSLTIYLC